MRCAFRSGLASLTAPALVLVVTGVSVAQDRGSVAGRVADDFGDPLAEVVVEALSVSGYRAVARTSVGGWYELPGLVAGVYSVAFSLEGYLPHAQSVTVRAGAPSTVGVSLVPVAPASLSGVVVDQQGLVLPGAMVEAVSPGAAPLVRTTDAAGRFVIRPVRPGSWSLVASLPGFVTERIRTDVAFAEAADVSLSLALDYALAEEVVVVGSRRQAGRRSVSDSLVPVDVLTAEELASQPHADMAELLRTLAPSFNVNTQPISDAATVVRPVNFRNLASDHLLVLVNGKRRHRSAVIAWLGNGISDGSQGPDVSVVPSIAVRQVELLRDGAAAQYGSDAIAGVVNFELRDAREGASVVVSTGSFLTPNAGDPATCGGSADAGASAHSCDGIGGRAGDYSLAANVGLPVGAAGFANLSLEYGAAEPTNRAVQRADAAALVGAGNRFVRDTAQVWGNPRVDGNLKVFANLGGQLGLLRPYGHAGYAVREVKGGFYYRHPYTRGGVFEGPAVDGVPGLLVGDRRAAESDGAVSAGCPVVPVVGGVPDAGLLAAVEAHPDCFTLYSRFPGGFAPQFGGRVTDASAVGGVRYVRADGFAWDASAGVGRSFIDHYMTHTVNASLGWDTPTVFRPGSAEQLDVNVNFDLAVPLRGGFHAAAGAEWRNETFALGPGDQASWAIGPYAAQGFSSGSNGFTGYRPDTAVGRWSRANVAAYADLERRDPADRWSVAGALRLERFADFGATLNGKAAGRYVLPAGFSVRAAASTGFRAPTPGQQNAFNVTTAFIGGRLVNRGVVPPTSAVAGVHGGRQLRPERSTHYAAGLVHQTPRVSLAADAFSVRVSDRLALSQEISLTVAEVAVLLSEGIVEAGNFPVFRFFVNDFATTTQGLDLTWSVRAGPGTLGGALSRTVTRVHSIAGRVIDDYRVATLERGLPGHRWQLWARAGWGRWTLLGRYNWYGSYWDSEDARNAEGIGAVSALLAYPVYPGRGVLDVEASLALSERTDLAVGVHNALSAWPAENPYAALTVGNRYGQFSPFGFDGAYAYARLGVRWGR